MKSDVVIVLYAERRCLSIDWDLGTCLHYECRHKQLRKPLQLTSWIDLRATYRVCAASAAQQNELFALSYEYEKQLCNELYSIDSHCVIASHLALTNFVQI